MVVAAILAGVHDSMRAQAWQDSIVEITAEMPAASDRVLFAGTVQKRPFADAGGNWRSMHCCVTEESLFLSRQARDPVCIHRIPLREMTAFNSKAGTGLLDRPVLMSCDLPVALLYATDLA